MIGSLVACGGTYGGQPTSPAAAKSGIRLDAAALPYAIVDARTGRAIDIAAFWTRLAGERVVCVGEEHSNPHDHWVELEAARKLFAHWPHGALGLEMIQRPFQGVLDDFAAHRIDEPALRSRVGWDERWGYDFGFYAPTLAVAIAAAGTVVALDAPTELTKQVAHHGIASLSPDEQAKLPELDLHDAAHHAWFDALMEDMGGADAHAHVHADMGSGSGDDDSADMQMPSADDIYAVQVIWDETMADTAATWLKAHPDGHMLILAGNGHCHDSAIVSRIKRRGIADVVSVRTVTDDTVSDALAKPINDFLVVLSVPKKRE